MPKLPRISSREAIRALEKLGFEQVRQTGSHVILQLKTEAGNDRLCRALSFRTQNRNPQRNSQTSKRRFTRFYQSALASPKLDSIVPQAPTERRSNSEPICPGSDGSAIVYGQATQLIDRHKYSNLQRHHP